MTRFRLTLALSMAVLLIGVATWKRFDQPATYVANLMAVQNGDNTISEEEAANAALTQGYADMGMAGNATSSTTTDPSLSDTDLIGRQLMTNYLSLAANGEATDENIDNLANNYADSITSLSTFQPIAGDAITVVPDSGVSFQTYSRTLSSVYKKYQALTASAVKTFGDMSDVSSPGFSSGMSQLSTLYARAASDLMTIPVPNSLASAHLKLVNNYLSSASSFKALANASNDSASAYAALATEAENSTSEGDILQTIQSVLAVNKAPFTISAGT